MGDLLAGTSILAAFVGGAIALFSPCCIVFLLPSYLASAVRNRRWRLIPLTFLFAAGLATILVPLTLGVGLLAQTLTRFHVPLYLGGGVLLVVLGVLSLLGKSWSMPSFARAPDVDRMDSAGMYALGVFSGIASSCCAPVLAGIMTLSALSGSTVGATGLGLAYVFGMTFPLFVVALLWDRFHLSDRSFLRDRPVRLRVAGRQLETTRTNVVVAAAFVLMGGMVAGLAFAGETTAAPGAQLAVGQALSSAAERTVPFIEQLPEPLLGVGLLLLAAGFALAGLRGRPDRSAPTGGSCHDHDDPTCHDIDRQEAAHAAP
jgi:cytochrome c-type biogenesis protein